MTDDLCTFSLGSLTVTISQETSGRGVTFRTGFARLRPEDGTLSPLTSSLPDELAELCQLATAAHHLVSDYLMRGRTIAEWRRDRAALESAGSES